MAGGALVRHNRLRVVPLAGRPARHVMAGATSGRSGDMRAALASGCAAIVATGTIGSRGEAAMVHLRASPIGGCLVTGLAASRHRGMDGRGRFAGQALATA